MSVYSSAIVAAGATTYWRLGGAVGTTTVLDASGHGNTATPTDVTFRAPGLLWHDADSAAAFNGTTSVITGDVTRALPVAASIELWLRTSTTRGGILAQFSDGSTNGDLTLYMDTDGQPHWRCGTTEIGSAHRLNDGRIWYVAASLDVDGTMHLWLDGNAVASASGASALSSFSGAWQVGSGVVAGLGLDAAPASAAFAGTIDEPAFYA